MKLRILVVLSRGSMSPPWWLNPRSGGFSESARESLAGRRRGLRRSINAQLPGYVRADVTADGRLQLEPIATGPGATLALSTTPTVALPARLLGAEAGSRP